MTITKHSFTSINPIKKQADNCVFEVNESKSAITSRSLIQNTISSSFHKTVSYTYLQFIQIKNRCLNYFIDKACVMIKTWYNLQPKCPLSMGNVYPALQS